MKIPRRIIFIFISLTCFVCKKIKTEAQNSEKADHAIYNVNILDLDREAWMKNQTVYISNDKISFIRPISSENISATEIIDGTGKFLVPGISEMHAHIPTPQDGDDSYVKEVLFLYLCNGITTIRGMLGQPYHLELKEQIRRNEILSPRVFTSSPSLNGNSIRSPEEADQKVRQYKTDGYDFLKLHPGLTLENFDAIVKTANAVGIEFAGHVSIDVGVRHAIESGYASIDHLDGYIEGLVPESAGVNPADNGFFGYNFVDIAKESIITDLVKLTKDYGVWVVPTHSLMINIGSERTGAEMATDPEMKYVSSSTLVGWRNGKQRMLGTDTFKIETADRFLALRDMILMGLHDSGVPVLLGSDAPQVFNVPGFSIQKEMQAMVHAGMRPIEVIKAGTVNPARYFEMEGEFGQIKEGFSADLILLEGDPLSDIRNMQKIEGVMVRGKWLSKDWIGKWLAEIEEKYKN